MQNTANHRGIELRPLSEAIFDLPTRRQASYTAWKRRQGEAAQNHPESFADLVGTVTAFADPLAAGAAQGLTWHPNGNDWLTPWRRRFTSINRRPPTLADYAERPA